MSAWTTIPVVATETAITALIEGQRFTSYDDFKIAPVLYRRCKVECEGFFTCTFKL